MFEDTTVLIPSTRITLLVDNPITSLIDHPNIVNKKGLPEIEIWRILDGTIAALKELQDKNSFHGFLSLENIYQVLTILVKFYKVLTPFNEIIYKISDG